MAGKNPVVNEVETREESKKIISDFNDIKTLFRNELATKAQYLDEINKNYYLYGADRKQELLKNKQWRRSNVKSLVTNTFVNRIYNMFLSMDNITEFINTNPSRSNEEKAQIADEYMLFYSWLLRQPDFSVSLRDWVKDAIKDGMGIFALDFVNMRETREYMQIDRTSKEEDVFIPTQVTYVTRRPVLRRVSWYNYTLDYNAHPLRTRWRIERMLATDEEIREMFGKYDWFSLKPVDPKEDAASTDFVSYIDFEARKNYYAYLSFHKKNEKSTQTNNVDDILWEENDQKKFNYDDMFSIKKNKKLREIFLVTNDEQVDIWINGISHGSFPLTWPINKALYKEVIYKRIEWSQLWVGVWFVCLPVQYTTEAIENCRIDDVIMSVNKNFKHISPTGAVTKNAGKEISYTPWKIHKMDEGEQLEELRVSSTDPAAYRESDFQFSMLQGALGIWYNVLGMQNKVERVSGIANMLQKASDEQSVELVDSYLDALAWIGKNALILSLSKMTQKQFDKILWKGNILSTLTVDEVIEDIEIIARSDDMKSKFDAVRSQVLINFLKEVWTMRDEQGKYIVNPQEIVSQIISALWLDEALVLDDADVQQVLQENNIDMSQENTNIESAINEQIDPMAQWWALEQMRALQWLGGEVPAEFTTNAWWVN